MLAAILTAAGLAGAAPTPPAASAAALMRHVSTLADQRLAGRAAGSAGEAEAARYVAAELARAGLEPRRQAVPAAGSVNVYALLAGRDTAAPAGRGEVIVVGAHIDHLGPGFPGAEDDASGVAVVLELARALSPRRRELGRSVLFVLFGAEERGALGSRAFVGAPPVPLARIAAMVNIDMIGRPLVDQAALALPKRALGLAGPRPVGLVGARDRPGLRALVDAACGPAGVAPVAAEDLPGPIDEEVTRQSVDRGDSVSFERAGIPALFFGSGESSDYHRRSDVAARVDPEILQRRARALLNVTVALSNTPPETLARAGANPPSPHAWTLPVGLSSGWAIHRAAPDGAYLGAEASVVRTESRSFLWLGVYADGARDFTRRATRVTGGPEVGLGPIGVDGGALLEIASGGHREGFVVRAIASGSLLSITGRVGRLVGAAPETFGEVGVLIKVPAVGRWVP